MTPWTVACQASLPMDSPGKNMRVGSHSPFQGIFPIPGIKPRSPTLQVDSLPFEPPGKPILCSRSIRVAANGIISLFLMTKKYSIVYTYHIFFIHSSVDGHLSCFRVLAIVNSAAVNTGVHISFQIMLFSGYISRSGIAGSYSSSRLLW